MTIEEPDLTDPKYAPVDTTFRPGKITKAQPIGVPIGYLAPYKGQRGYDPNLAASEGIFPMSEGGTPGIGARYYEDDLDRVRGFAPEMMTQLQYRLKDAGLLKSFRKGEWTDAEDDAMARVFQFANRQGLLWEDALEVFAGMAEEVGGSGGGGRAFTARLSNPDDLKKAFTQSLYDAQGGRFIDDNQMQAMIDAYNQIEYSSQRAAFDNAGTVIEPPTAATFAAEEARKRDPAGVDAAKFADYGAVFEELINGG